MGTNNPPSRRRATDEEILEAVTVACEENGEPVAKTEWVAGGLPIKQRATFKRLERLEGDDEEPGDVVSIKVGSGRVWYIPDEEQRERTGAVGTTINFDAVDPEAVPEEFAEEVRDTLEDVNRWELWNTRGQQVAELGALSAVFGFGVLLIRELEISQIPTIPDWFLLIWAFAFLGGVGFVLVGSVTYATTTIGNWATDEERRTATLERIKDAIPVSWDR